MRVLFIESHPMWIHGLPNGFRDAGHEVLVSGPITKESLQNNIFEFKPDLIITMGWGPENTLIKKQHWIRDCVEYSKVPHIYWATEDPTHTQSFSIPYLKTVQPDFVFTICPKNVDYYERLGINAAHLDFGFHHSVHCPTNPHETYRSNIAIVANAYPNRLKMYPEHFRHKSLNILIKPLLEANVRIDFYGRYWDNMYPFLGTEVPKEWIHGYLPYTEANKVYSSADIVIGLQNSLTQLTQRTYEILGSGGFLLTNDTPEVCRIFKANHDLVVSSSQEMTLHLIKYYLNNPEQREIIRWQGYASVSKHSYTRRAEKIIDVLNKRGVFNGKRSEYKLSLMECTSFIRDGWELYALRNGDTLYDVSKTFNTSVEQLMELNQLNSHWVDAGQVLRIRRLSSSSESNHLNQKKVLRTEVSRGSEGNIKNYIVKDGDTLWAISKKFSMSVEKLMKLNGLVSSVIYAGQCLKIDS